MASQEYDSVPAMGVATGTPVTTVAPSSGFSSGLCECNTDWCSCCAATFCGPTVTAQLTERLVHKKRHTCIVLAIFLWFVAISQFIFNDSGSVFEGKASYSYDDKSDTTPENVDAPVSTSAVIASVAGLFSCAFCLLTCLVRRTIRARDNIPATVCSGSLDDLLLSCCCTCCVQAQILRHEGMVGGRYKLASADGVTEMV